MRSLLFIIVFAIANHAQTPAWTNDEVRILGKPAADAKIVEVLQKGSGVDVLLQRGEWYLVQTTDYVGWLPTGRINFTLAPVPLASPSRSTSAIEPIEAPRETYRPSRTYIRGPRGGCYYINSKGNKTYVDRSLCN